MYVINIFGGPSSGKSTLATKIFSELKINSKLKVEYVHEYAKDLVYEKRFNILSNDQLYVFAKQNHMLKMIELGNEIDVVIVDSPLILSAVFGNLYKSTSNIFNKLVIETFNTYKNINVFLERENNFFQSYGRVENSINEAKNVDEEILKILKENNIKFIRSNYSNILENIVKQLKDISEFCERIKKYE